MTAPRWLTMWGPDPRPWLLASDEPAARWIALTALHGKTDDDPEVIEARRAVLTDPATHRLLDLMPDWEVDNNVSGHHKPEYAPNLLNLLADMGVRPGDDDRIDRLLDQMLDHTDDDGRFEAYGRARTSEAVWGSVPCDHHAITEVMLRYGRGDDQRVTRAIERIAADLRDTEYGRAWGCLPHTTSGWRGPGRKADPCPQVTLEALRVFALAPADLRPDGLLDAARTTLNVWRRRAERNPYMFGHGVGFKTVKWPTTWYDAQAIVATLAAYPRLWRGKRADPRDRRAVAELLASLVAYNVAADGTVTPRSCFKGFETFSFGQRKQPSPFATAHLSRTVAAYGELADEVTEVDVMALASSRGSGRPVGPKAS